MYDYYLTATAGHDGSVYYAQAMNEGTAAFWDQALGVLAAAPAHADTVMTLTEINSSGTFGWLIPAGMPLGRYRLMLRLRATGSPLNSDPIIQSVTGIVTLVQGFVPV